MWILYRWLVDMHTSASHLPSSGAPTTLYGHVVRLPTEDTANLILCFWDPSGWIMPSYRQHALWLRQMRSIWRIWDDGPGVCLGDGQTDAEAISSGGRDDALLR